MSQILESKNRVTLRRAPSLLMCGDVEHADFRESVELLRADANVVTTANSSPEIIVFFHSRPLSVSSHSLQGLRNLAPLAGVAVVAGSWCEGELRTGRVWPACHRQYWYEFPAWWRRQVALRAAGRCPDWAKPPELVALPATIRPPSTTDFVILRTPCPATAETLADHLHAAGYGTTLQSQGRRTQLLRGAALGIWDGGQLNDAESQDLFDFCSEFRAHPAPVIALLDFPRRDSVDRAIQLGATAILGKPWLNANLVQTIEQLTARKSLPAAA
jgi:CheY-like chemotaxis protein